MSSETKEITPIAIQVADVADQPVCYIGFKIIGGGYVGVPCLKGQTIKDAVQTFTVHKQLTPGSFKLFLHGHLMDEPTMELVASEFPFGCIHVAIDKSAPVPTTSEAKDITPPVQVEFSRKEVYMVKITKDWTVKQLCEHLAVIGDMDVETIRISACNIQLKPEWLLSEPSIMQVGNLRGSGSKRVPSK